MAQFSDPDEQAASVQLATLREGNGFLWATEEAMPNVKKIHRYFRSECIVRVSCFHHLWDKITTNGSQGVASRVTWPESHRRIKETEKVVFEGQKIWSHRNPKIPPIFRGNCGMFFFELLNILNTDSSKLYFLLDTRSIAFSEDDDRFRNFFENRYISLDVKLQDDLPQVLREMMEWLNREVFEQEQDEEEEALFEEQIAFEEDLDGEINAARDLYRRRREAAIAEMRGEPGGEADAEE